MLTNQLQKQVIQDSGNLIWVVDSKFHLNYANQAYTNLIKKYAVPEETKNESVLLDGFHQGAIKKWTAYYTKAFQGESFKIENKLQLPNSNKPLHSHIMFTPIFGSSKKLKV